MSSIIEKGVLPSTEGGGEGARPTYRQQCLDKAKLSVVVIILASFWIFSSCIGVRVPLELDRTTLLEILLSFHGKEEQRCPQVNVLMPQANAPLWNSLNVEIGTPEFKSKAIDWLAGSVRIPTESYDSMDPVGVDPRWGAMRPFHDYLYIVFPLVHSTLQLIKVNTYGLHYEWTGSDSTLKPIMLTAHQDVVPVDPTTVDQWKYPPYSGHFDGERIWGRGSADDKSGLIGILSAIETLITSGFKPTRTVVVSFGFDEEASGTHGAGSLGPHLEKNYGENGIAMIVDEGSGFGEWYGSVIATPGIAEKGYLDALLRVTTPGGHSSVPPPHTSIGILASLLVELERNPTKVELTRREPIYQSLQCLAEHGESVPSQLRKTIKLSSKSDRVLHKLQRFIRGDKTLSSMIRTTQAIDVIHGGVKSNALPEQAWAIVNHRIAVVSSLDEIKARDIRLLESLAKTFNLTYEAFGKTISEEGAPSSGTLTLSDPDNLGLEPAPITPTGADAAPYHLLSGTIKATYNAHRSILNTTDAIVVAPGMMSGNTDTRFYWKLTPHIFRYNHHQAEGDDKGNGLGAIHTVNENMRVDSFLEMILFFATLILNADESRSI